MIHELIYTSAQNTFDGPGYGVVARTRDIPDAVQRQMLRLCRFDFLSSEQATASSSAEMISHTLVTDGQTWHILSRTGAAGMDYTNRTVFIAHHVAISADELGNRTPFDLVLSPHLFRREWSGDPSLLTPRSITDIRPSAAPAGLWRKVFGHDKALKFWSGMHSRRKFPLFLVADSSDNSLKMFCEAARQQEPAEARNISFMSALGADHKGIRFDWIGLLKGSHLAESVMKVAPEKVVDSTRPRQFTPAELDLPTVPVRAPGPQAPVPVERSLPTEIDAYDLCWQEDMVTSTMTRPREISQTPPPPPPPPRRGASPAMIWIAVTVAGLLVGIGLTLFFRSNPPPAEVAPSETQGNLDPQAADAGSAPDSGIGSPGLPVSDPPAIPLASGDPSNVPGFTAVPMLPDNRPPVPAHVEAPKYPLRGHFYLKQGLQATSLIASQKWNPLTPLHPGPKLTKFTVLGDLADKLITATTPEGFRISTRDKPDVSITLRLSAENQLEMLCSQESGTRDLFALLRLCLLRIEGHAGPIPDGKEVQYEISLNAPHPVLRSGYEPSRFDEDMHEFYDAAHKYRATVTCRIDSVSLLPVDTSSIPVRESHEVKDSQTMTFRFVVPVDNEPIPFELPVQPFFDRNQPDPKAPLTMHPITSPAVKPKVEPATPKEKAGVKPGTGKPAAAAKPVESLPASESLTNSSHAELLTEVFRRFGSARGVLLIRREENGSRIDTPVVRFGGVEESH